MAEFGFMFEALVTALPAVLIVLIIASGSAFLVFAAALTFQRFTNAQAAFVAMLLFCLGLVGAAAGFSGGFSRSAVVGDIIPAILGLIGGVVLYIFGVAQNKTLLPAFGVVSLICALIVGYSTGANFRGQTERRDASIEEPAKLKAAFCAQVANAFGRAKRTAGPGQDQLAQAMAAELRALCATDG